MSDASLPALPVRDSDAHKGNCGRILVIAGSLGMTGAGCLASEAAYRSGAGLVTWAVPEKLAHLAESKTMETIIWPVPSNDAGQFSIAARELLAEASHEADVVMMGPGMGVAGETGELQRLLIPELHAPLILDAGALTAMGTGHKPLEKRSGKVTILTPHPGEMARLTGKKVADIQADREGAAAELAQKTGTIVVLKGAQTIVSDGKLTFQNNSGNPGMATAGSGDVLAGATAGLLGQMDSALEAVRLAVYLHGLAGDIACELLGPHSVMAGDILRALPRAFLKHRQHQS